MGELAEVAGAPQEMMSLHAARGLLETRRGTGTQTTTLLPELRTMGGGGLTLPFPLRMNVFMAPLRRVRRLPRALFGLAQMAMAGTLGDVLLCTRPQI